MFRWHDCLEGHILLGYVFSIAAVVLLLLVTLSTPYTRSIAFLNVSSPNGSGSRPGSSSVSFGSFGYCTTSACDYTNVGYDYRTGGEIIRWLTRTIVLFPVAAVTELLALLFLTLGLLRVGRIWRNPIYFRSAAVLAAFLATLAEIFALILWVTARTRFNVTGSTAKYGSALWLGLAGAFSAFMCACIGGPPYTGTWMYRAHHGVAYNV